MARINVAKEKVIHTHEGGRAVPVNALQQLRRLTLATLLWEDQFYVDGVSIADAIAATVKQVDAEDVAKIAIEARTQQKLRHLPLLLVRELARKKGNPKGLVADTLAGIVQRPDELAEFLAIYWKEKKQPLAAQVKKGLARAFAKFNEYSLAKYDWDGAVKLRDVLFLTHPKPTKQREELYKKIAERKLETPDTWEVTLSKGEGKKTDEEKKQHWERLLKEEKLGALALLRNLRNMEEAKVERNLVKEALENIKPERVLPFRFIAAANHAPHFEPQLEVAMLKCLTEKEKLSGSTVLLIDVSGSMEQKVSGKSEISRLDAACGVAMLAREICEDVDIYTFSNTTERIPSRRGFALRDKIVGSQPHGSTMLGSAMSLMNTILGVDRLIVITDEQSHETVSAPRAKKAYLINVASYQNGVGYRNGWQHIDGWSEAAITYIQELEKTQE